MKYRTFLFAAILGIMNACGGGGEQSARSDSTTVSPSGQPGKDISSPASKAAGAYQGTLPCADCPGIDYQLSLYEDQRYQELMVYRGRNDGRAVIDTGMWNMKNDSIIELAGQQPHQFLFEDGKLYHLNREGQRITGALADNYILRPVGGEGNYRQLREKAAAGVDFHATGNEPGWVLELDRKTILFQDMNGDSLRVPTPRPHPNTDTLRVYTPKHEKAEFIITIRQRACTDDMSGYMRPYTVEVQLKDKNYRGCGQYLR
ncbi:copper resistance protein NlpE N-terminal domain-containing protein [uncultured Chitinophaga sp.]|jgi:Predicted membrane protein|uniref:copper resistance protein NlpE N-terminal domain-containing protein n=1 Tax=uncultured Chitinophaga sp. TaxID=339340 RepID=UPI00260BE41C|nr:copper resistance protein NlpE N-terminal domain-containing protein [uncultured Chitinophaga sp.]